MIRLTRLDGEPFVLNADLIRYIEQRPDTFITLTSGDRMVVKESMDEVLDQSVRYQQAKYQSPSSDFAELSFRLATGNELERSSDNNSGFSSVKRSKNNASHATRLCDSH